MSQYVPVLVIFALTGVVMLVLRGANRFLAPKTHNQEVLGEAFECGNEPSGSAWGRFSVKFYMTAILFIIFDVEVVFMYPWAVIFRELGWFGLAEMLVFMAVLGLALLYVWRKGALEWE